MVLSFPFAANALRQAESVVYPEPYVTPLTRKEVKEFNAAEQEIARQRIKEEGTQGISKFSAQEIAEIKRLHRDEKLSTHQIARQFGCAQSSIWWHVTRPHAA